MARRNHSNTRKRKNIDYKRRNLDRRYDEAYKYYQAKQRRRKRVLIDSINTYSLNSVSRSRRDTATTATTVTNRIARQIRNVPRRFFPLSFATIKNPMRCKRAKTAERHNVMRKIQTFGRGSILKRTLKRKICNG